MRLRWMILAAAVATAGGCKWFKSPTKENIDPPTELSEFSPSLTVHELWSRKLGSGVGKAGLRLKPTYADGVVFAVDIEGTVYALDESSGKPLWQTDVEARLGSSAGVGDDLVVVGTLDGGVVALNKADGQTRWTAQVSSEVLAQPAIADGIVVVRSNDGRAFGLNAADGERAWAFDRTVPLLSLRGGGTPLVQDGTAYIGYDSGKIAAIAMRDGTMKWEQTIAQPEGKNELERLVDIDGEIAIDGSRLFAATYRGQIAALDLSSGRLSWNRETSDYGGLSLAGGNLFIANDQGHVIAMEGGAGSTLWRQEGLAYRWLSTPASDGRYVIVGDLEGYVHWLDASTGAFAARERVGDKPIRAAATVANDKVFVQGSDGELAAFSVDSN